MSVPGSFCREFSHQAVQPGEAALAHYAVTRSSFTARTSAGHLQILDRLLTTASLNARLVGIVESARGLAAVEAIASATPRLFGLMLGAADMAADLGATTAWEPLAFARSRLVATCTLAGVMAIDAPYFDVRDEAGLQHEVAAACRSCRRETGRARACSGCRALTRFASRIDLPRKR